MVVSTTQGSATGALAKPTEPSGTAGVDVRQHLLDWACEPGRASYFVLLGDLGTGKTTACHELVRALAEVGVTDTSASPSVVYFDLRQLERFIPRAPTATEVLDALCGRTADRTTPARQPLTAPGLIQLASEESAIIIVDGVDELLINRSSVEARDIIGHLRRSLTTGGDFTAAGNAHSGSGSGRLLLTCRTHAFQTVGDQQAFFCDDAAPVVGPSGTESEQADIDHANYEALVLLPFTEQQVADYLSRFLPPELTTADALGLLDRINGLRDLASRPALLAPIADRLHTLRRSDPAAPTDGTELYTGLVEQWVRHSEGNPKLSTDLKIRLMEDFAQHLASSGLTSLATDTFDRWLLGRLSDDRDLHNWFLFQRALTTEQFCSTVRAATFVVRTHTEQSVRGTNFWVRNGAEGVGFAHHAFFDHFLARWVHRQLREGRIDRLTSVTPTKAVRDVLGAFIARSDTATCIDTLAEVLTMYRPGLTEWVFRYCAEALQYRRPLPSLNGADIRGAQLDGLRVVSNEDKELSIDGLRAERAHLRYSIWENVSLQRATFDASALDRAEFHRSWLTNCTLREASLAGTLFRICDLTRVDLEAAALHRTRLVAVQGLEALQADAEMRSESLLFAPLLSHASEPGSPLREVEDGPVTYDSTETPKLQTFTGHNDLVYGVSLSSDDRWFATASDDGTVRLWDLEAGECTQVLVANPDTSFASVAISGDGKRIAAGGQRGEVVIWDRFSGEQVLFLVGHELAVTSVAANADGTVIVSASDDSTIRIWDGETGQCLHELTDHNDEVTGVAFNPSGSRIVSSSRDETARVWDVATGECIRVLDSHASWVNAVAWSSDGSRISTASDDNTAKIWDAERGDCLLTLADHFGPFSRISCNADGSRLVTADSDSNMNVWNGTTGERIASFCSEGPITSGVAINSAGSTVVSSDYQTSISVWNASTGQVLHDLRWNRPWEYGLSFADDGTCQVVLRVQGAMTIWDGFTGEPIHALPPKGRVGATAISGDRSRFATRDGDDVVCVWDGTSGALLHRCEEPSKAGLAISNDGAYIATGGPDNAILVWDGATGELLNTLSGCPKTIAALAIAADGATIASVSRDGSGRIWDTATGECRLVLTRPGISTGDISISADGTRVVTTGSDRALRVWDVRSGECVRVLEGHTGILNSVSISGNGTRIVSGGYDATVRIWDAETGECLQLLTGRPGVIKSVALNLDGTQAASSHGASAVLIWNALSGERVRTIELLPAGQIATFDGDGKLVTCTADAWRSLGYRATLADGTVTRIPAETFGPLPVDGVAEWR